MVSSQELQVGDIIEVESGTIVPADAIIISAENLFADESTITGQMKQIAKTGCEQFKDNMGGNCFLISGAKIF